jgi:hypothetical protein
VERGRVEQLAPQDGLEVDQLFGVPSSKATASVYGPTISNRLTRWIG